MSLKSSLLALAENIGMCQENARSIKQALAGGLAGVAANTLDDWTLVKTETGNTEITLPDSFNELYIYVTRSHSSVTIYLAAPVVAALDDTANAFYEGSYATASANVQVRVKVSTTKAQMDQFYYGGSDLTSSASVSVYYR